MLKQQTEAPVAGNAPMSLDPPVNRRGSVFANIYEGVRRMSMSPLDQEKLRRASFTPKYV